MVEFTIRTKDLKHAIKELSVNRDPGHRNETADILVSECVATFRAVGTETEVPVVGKKPGSVRLSLTMLRKLSDVAATFKGKEIPVVFAPGISKVGTMTVKHPDIELGVLPDRKLTVPVDLSVLDTLAIARLLTPQQLVEQGLRERVEEAQRGCSNAIGNAAAALQEFKVDSRQVQTLVDTQITRAAERLPLT